MNFYPLSFFAKVQIEKIEKLEHKGEDFLFQNLLYLFIKYETNAKDIQLLEKAFEFGKNIHKNQMRESGVKYFTHPIIVALLMIPYEPCAKLLIATLLHDAIEDSEHEGTADEIQAQFGDEVLLMIEGVSKVQNAHLDKQERSVQTLQKLFEFGAKDSRTLFIKIFDRLHNIITLAGKKSLEKRQKKVAETTKIYLPAIERLGFWRVKKTMEDASMRSAYPNKYKEMIDLSEACKSSSVEILKTIKKICKKSHSEYQNNNNIKFEIKHYSTLSLFQNTATKINKKEYTFFIRCVVPNQEDCYKFSKRLGELFPQKDQNSKDFIANPKINKYKALHSTHIVDNSYAVRFHIMSEKMHKRNDQGLFVETHKKDYTLPFLSETSLLLLQDDSDIFLAYLTGDILVSKIPIHNAQKGEVNISEQSTLLDSAIFLFPEKFQYISHGYINNKEKTLFSSLKENDIVSFHFNEKKESRIHLSWIFYVKTPLAKEKIQKILSLQPSQKKEEIGHDLLQNIFDEEKVGEVETIFPSYIPHISYLKGYTVKEIYILIAEGKILRRKILNSIISLQKEKKSFLTKILPWEFFKNNISNNHFTFLSSLKKLSTIDVLLDKYAYKNNIEIVSRSISVTNAKGAGTVHSRSTNEKNQRSFLTDLGSDPRIEFISKVPPLHFILKIFSALVIPFLIASAMFFLSLTENDKIPSSYFYIGGLLIVFSNSVGYMIISRYFSQIRNNLLFLFVFIFSNISIISAYLFLFFKNGGDIYGYGFYISLLLILFSMAFPAFFFRKKKVYGEQLETYTSDEFKEKQKQKWIGYGLRFGAVIIWGLQPLLMKYTAFNDINNLVGTFTYLLGVFLFSIISLFVIYLLSKKNKDLWNPRLPINPFFFIFALGQIIYIFFINSSLSFTSGTSHLLLNNFAPIFALIVAFLFWRIEIPYLKEKKNALFVFLLFMIGGFGSSFVLYNDLSTGSTDNLIGDAFSLCAMVIDTVVLIAQIRYVKLLKTNQSFFIPLYVSIFGSFLLLPFVYSALFHLTASQIYWSLFIGVLTALGSVLTSEAFRRMDGFIGFLMFNISIIITFSAEAFIFKTVEPTIFLILGAVLIIGSSIFAEKINTKCEKKQIKD